MPNAPLSQKNEGKGVNLPALSQSKLTRYARLSEKKFRTQEGLFLAEGERNIMQLLVSEEGQQRLQSLIFPEAEPLFYTRFLSSFPSGIPKAYGANPNQWNALCETESPQHILAVFEIPQRSFDDVITVIRNPTQAERIVLLDRLQDPGNAGTIIRSAAWFGFTAVVFAKGSVDAFSPKVVRSAAGAHFSIPIYNAPLTMTCISSLLECDISILAGAMDGEPFRHVAREIANERQLCIVIGNEGEGVEDEVLKRVRKVSIPGRHDRVESLNAAVAATILMEGFSFET